jgi:hypothetical protein
LTSAYQLLREDDAYATFVGDCGTFNYDVAVYVDADTHLYAVGFPNEDAEVKDTAQTVSLQSCSS